MNHFKYINGKWLNWEGTWAVEKPVVLGRACHLGVGVPDAVDTTSACRVDHVRVGVGDRPPRGAWEAESCRPLGPAWAAGSRDQHPLPSPNTVPSHPVLSASMLDAGDAGMKHLQPLALGPLMDTPRFPGGAARGAFCTCTHGHCLDARSEVFPE